MKTANYTDLRNNLKSYLDVVINDSELLIVHRPGNASVVVIPLEEYNAMKKYIQGLSYAHEERMEDIRVAEEDYIAGRTVTSELLKKKIATW